MVLFLVEHIEYATVFSDFDYHNDNLLDSNST